MICTRLHRRQAQAGTIGRWASANAVGSRGGRGRQGRSGWAHPQAHGRTRSTAISSSDDSHVWLHLHARRFSMPKTARLAATASRSGAFSAAMRQFEEQIAAARVVSAVTRPINLYYGLVQAGYAVAAAHAADPWSFSRHGLTVVDTAPDLPTIAVRPESRGAYQVVSEATGSPTVSGPVTIGALWRSLPGVGDELPFGSAPDPATMQIFPELTYHQPEPGGQAFRMKVYVDRAMPDAAGREAWFKEFRGQYPGLSGWRLAKAPDAPPAWMGSQAPYDPFEYIREDRFNVELEHDDPDPRTSRTHDRDIAFFDTIAPQHRYRHERFLRPSIEGSPPPSPLMTWWLLLYTFSMLARYQPRKWVSSLDMDRSNVAAVINHALDQAIETVPHLVLEALDGQPHLLGRPLTG